MEPLLIVGVPRSGTTWTGRVLGHTEGVTYVNEPDGFRDPFAFGVMVARGENPILAAGDAAADCERLWSGAFGGGRPAGSVRDRVAHFLYARVPLDARRAARASGRPGLRSAVAARLSCPRVAEPDADRVVVKSVQSILALEWIVDRFRPRVLVVERNPLNVLASWIELGYVRNLREQAALARYAHQQWGIDAPAESAPHLVRQTFTYAVLATALRAARAHHPEWLTTTHEWLCVDPKARFQELAASAALVWGSAAEVFLSESDRAGTPYRTQRVTADQPDRWRNRLDPEQLDTIRATLAPFPALAVPES